MLVAERSGKHDYETRVDGVYSLHLPSTPGVRPVFLIIYAREAHPNDEWRGRKT